jgi:RNA polymerase sigma-70 factor (ECF subfamily)
MEETVSRSAADDIQLLAALRLGQAPAFETLMRRYNRLLFRAARGIVGDDAEAQDVVQEAYLHAFLHLQSFRGEASLATWLTRIAINQALSQQRKLGRLVPWNEDLADQEIEMSAKSPSAFSDAEPSSPEQDFARQQLRRRLEAAVNLLPPIYRTVFILRAVHGVSVEDTALALEVSEDVVKTRFLRARALLRTRLTGDPQADAASLYEFLGQRCDDTVAAVLARLRALGIIRDQ